MGKIDKSGYVSYFSTVPYHQDIPGRKGIMFVLLAGGLLIVIVAVIIAVVSSVTAAVAVESDIES